MHNNLEDISFEEVMDREGISYDVFRKNLAADYVKVWVDIFKGYFFLLVICGLLLFFDHRIANFWWIIVPIAALLIGYIAAYLALFIHEAGHFNVHPDKKANDRLATFFLCLPFGLSIRSYRKIHWQHHVHLGTPEDTETSYFHGLSKIFILESLTGIHLLRTIKGQKIILTKEQIRNSRIMLLAGFFTHALILTAGFLTGNWLFAVSWILGFGVFFPFFATLRQVLEHRDELAAHHTDFRKQPHGKLSRLFGHTIVSSSFGSAGFTRHMIHHWDPQVSYTRLKEIEAFLSQSERTTAIIRSSKTSYQSILKKLLKAR